MTGDTLKGRSVETVHSELQAIESRTSSTADPALQREFEDGLFTPSEVTSPRS